MITCTCDNCNKEYPKKYLGDNEIRMKPNSFDFCSFNCLNEFILKWQKQDVCSTKEAPIQFIKNDIVSLTRLAKHIDEDEKLNKSEINSREQNKPSGSNPTTAYGLENSSRVIGTQNDSGKKSIVSSPDTHSQNKDLMDKDYNYEMKDGKIKLFAKTTKTAEVKHG